MGFTACWKIKYHSQPGWFIRPASLFSMNHRSSNFMGTVCVFPLKPALQSKCVGVHGWIRRGFSPAAGCWAAVSVRLYNPCQSCPWPRFSFSLRNASPASLPCGSPVHAYSPPRALLAESCRVMSVHKFLPRLWISARGDAEQQRRSQLATFRLLTWRRDASGEAFFPRRLDRCVFGKHNNNIRKVVRKTSPPRQDIAADSWQLRVQVSESPAVFLSGVQFVSGRALRREKKKRKNHRDIQTWSCRVCLWSGYFLCCFLPHRSNSSFFSSFCTLTYPVVYYVVVDHSAYFLTSAQTHTTELKLWLIVLCVLWAESRASDRLWSLKLLKHKQTKLYK